MAVQLIPELAEKASELTVYQRTPIWVLPNCGRGLSDRPKPRKSGVAQARPASNGTTCRKSNELDG